MEMPMEEQILCFTLVVSPPRPPACPGPAGGSAGSSGPSSAQSDGPMAATGQWPMAHGSCSLITPVGTWFVCLNPD